MSTTTRLPRFLPALTLFSLLSAAVSAQILPPYMSVTDARLRNQDNDSWLLYRGSYDSHGYSALDQIDTDNVASLKPVWSFSTGLREGHQAPPIVNNGYMYVSTPQNHVLALNAVTGDLLWRYVRYLPDDLQQFHPTNRGVALYGDLAYLATVDAVLVALDALTGEVVWEVDVEDYYNGYYMTMAPLIVDGVVMVGVSGGELGIRGFVAAFDAETGEELWKTYTIPAPGEPGSESWPEDTWKTGGVPVWITGSYDPDLNLTYWGTGNGGPWMGDTRPGDNLYSTSVIALDPKTGELKNHHQYHWNDSWDWDEVSAPLLIDYEREGKIVKGLVHPGRNGYLWFLERSAEQITFVDANPYVYQDVFTSIDAITGRPEYDMSKKPGTGYEASFCPSLWGGKDWPPAAFDPNSRLLFIPANENVCSTMVGEEIEYSPGRAYMGRGTSDDGGFFVRDGADHIGELQAWNVDTGERAWTTTFESHNWGPILATAGDLVFMGGTNDRKFRAFDSTSGEVLWEYPTNSGVIGVPVTFTADGKQYVAVQSGWGVDAQREQNLINMTRGSDTYVPQGGVVWVFALP
ncbi:PQQ-dependent dehydrogenase, methanol/ethanol family [Gammaproteobacteria bacterium]|jgi:alcohol dehydrogenase (cytochrome c)|nr:PQQ-dependent dehydrogenase, methanol/ethanol family [Gammaproteobacteria bacterium]